VNFEAQGQGFIQDKAGFVSKIGSATEIGTEQSELLGQEQEEPVIFLLEYRRLRGEGRRGGKPQSRTPYMRLRRRAMYSIHVTMQTHARSLATLLIPAPAAVPQSIVFLHLSSKICNSGPLQ
jgi:hypothetical protein